MVIKQHIIRIPLMPVGWALLFALVPMLQAQPHLMADEEMDQVCAKGSVGVSVDPVALNQIFFQFSRLSSLGLVAGSGSVTVDVIPSASGKTQVILGSPVTVGTPGASLPTSVQVMNGSIRITGNLNINLDTLPSIVSALQKNQVALPPGFNPLAGGGMQGLGAMHP
ncbi:MAG: hypothetical protein WCS70_01965 [Verrucomicrobiota bacterium]